MVSGGFRFEQFTLDPAERRLIRGGEPVELNGRYLDALALLVREQGRLVAKDRFLDEVWHGVPVTDEALTQCIKTLRQALGDKAAAPRFIETVPKYGYRFIAPVEAVDAPDRAVPDRRRQGCEGAASSVSWREFLVLGSAGTAGALAAGMVGGLCYGFAAAAQLQEGPGAASVLLVLLLITMLVALVGGAGVAFGIAAARFARGSGWTIVGGAAGGLLVGGLVKLIGVDAFNLFFGRAPSEMTGAAEGALLGASVGFGAWLARVRAIPVSPRRSIAVATAAGAAAGLLVPLLGGRMLGGSLDLLARQFPESRLSLDSIGRLFGEGSFGPASQAATAGLEGGLFAGAVVAAMLLVRRRPTTRTG